MHPHDATCRWCGFGPLFVIVPSEPGMLHPVEHECPNKPPRTPEEGFAVGLGMIEMGQAIRARKRKCPTCRCRISIATDKCMCCASSAIFDAIDEGEGR